jgi:hypothetical protein
LAFGNRDPGEGELIDVTDDLQMEERVYYYGFIEEIVTNVVREVRAYFRDNPSTSAYRWIGKSLTGGAYETDMDVTKIHISPEYSDNPRKYPSIMVQDVNLNLNDLFLGQNMGSLVIQNPDFDPTFTPDPYVSNTKDNTNRYIEVGERLGGKAQGSVTLNIRALSRLERDRVTDLLLKGMVVPIRRALAKLAMNFVPNSASTNAGAPEDLTEEQKIFTRNFTFSLQVEWYSDFFYDTAPITDFTLNRIYLAIPPQT